MNFQKIIGALMGLAVLAGLAMHQGQGDPYFDMDPSDLVGTALEKPPENPESIASEAGEMRTGQNDCERPESASAETFSEETRCDPESEEPGDTQQSNGGFTGL